MLHLKNSVTNKKPKKTMGFSLIELLVVVAIIGILAAVAIPAYNNYRINAAQGSLTSSLNNIGKAYSACLTLRAAAQCDTLQEIGVSCSNCDNVGASSGQFCADAEVVVGAMAYKGCVSSTGGIHTILGSWPRRCDEFGVNYACTSGSYVAPAMTCTSFGCTPPATTAPAGTCTSAIFHSCATANSQDLTKTNPNGVCDDTAGTCS